MSSCELEHGLYPVYTEMGKHHPPPCTPPGLLSSLLASPYYGMIDCNAPFVPISIFRALDMAISIAIIYVWYALHPQGGKSNKATQGRQPPCRCGKIGGRLSNNTERNSHPARDPPVKSPHGKVGLDVAKDQFVNNGIDDPVASHSLGLTPVPAAIMTTLRWAGGGISLSSRKGPFSCTAGLSKVWHDEAKNPIAVQPAGRVVLRFTLAGPHEDNESTGWRPFVSFGSFRRTPPGHKCTTERLTAARGNDATRREGRVMLQADECGTVTGARKERKAEDDRNRGNGENR